jgi:trk system potassium uptake protein TrkH
MFHYKTILHILGLLLLFNAAAMLVASMASLFLDDGATSGLLLSTGITFGVGLTTMLLTLRQKREIKKRDGYLIVVLGWLVMVVFGTLPFLTTGSFHSLTDAFFETMSGYTATGATIIQDIEALPKSLILWRSLTHWLGGMGIIVLAIAILPLLGIGGVQLFSAEAPGVGGDKLHPRISDTAKRLWYIYVGFTALQTLLLSLAGMSVFDAVNHAMSTMASGGFSSKNASMAHWNHLPLVQYIVIVFMFLAGSNFVLIYLAIKGKFKRVFSDNEFRWYAGFVLAFTIISFVGIYTKVDLVAVSTMDHPQVLGKLESSFRHALFQVVAVITTTGLVTADFTSFTPFLTMLFFGLFFLGGSSGSTSGGVKVVRHLILIKNGFLEFKKALHPNAILSLRLNNTSIDQSIVFRILAFFILYMIMFIIGAGVFSFLGLDFTTAVGASASSLGNVGPGLGSVGPALNYAELPVVAKWWSSFYMLVGRLELFTVLMLFTPYFWRDL